MRHDTIASFRKSRHYDVVTCSTLPRGDGSKICASKLISRQISTLQINSSVWLLCSFKPSPERWLAENIRFPTTLKVTLGRSTPTQQFVEKKRWNKSIRGGLPGGWRPGEVVTRPNCRGPHMARQLPAVRGDGSGAERSAARVVDPLLTPAVFTSPGTADTRVSQLFHWWISLSVQTSVI